MYASSSAIVIGVWSSNRVVPGVTQTTEHALHQKYQGSGFEPETSQTYASENWN
jgi:hypothetical protein